MQIQGRSLGQASQALADHLNDILNHCVTQKRLAVVLSRPSDGAAITFREHGSASFAMLTTNYGRMELDLRQICDAVPDEETGLLTLRTLSYRYTIRPEGATEPLLRWEYVRFPADPDARWSRHHFQGPIPLGIHDRSGIEATLNRWHLPSGPIAVEDVVRCCIVDLGTRPLSDDWDRRLQDT